MTGIPLELPVKASEAAAVAEAVFQHADNRALDDELRAQINARLAAAKLSSLRAYGGSLQQDPVHRGVFYLSVDGAGAGEPRPLLLRIALASSPASGLFPKAMLIGRMRPGGGREVVVNAIPFSPRDSKAVRTYATQVDRAFLPRPLGIKPAIRVAAGHAESEAAAAFAEFRQVWRQTGVNLASIAARPADVDAVVWAAIRAGWREGYALVTRLDPSDAALAAGFTGFIVAAGCRAIDEVYDGLRQARAAGGLGRGFDFEIEFDARRETGAHEMAPFLDRLRGTGRPAHLARVYPDFGKPLVDTSATLHELAAVARSFNVTLSFRPDRELGDEHLRAIGKAAAGRWNYEIPGDAIGSLARIARQLRG